jgi:manganese/zinc/iron transport system permease protein
MAACALVVCLAAVALFKEFKLLCFDPGFARGIGFPVSVLDGLLMLLIVLSVVIGLQAVGVVLMAALLITPAAAARLWTDRLDVMVWLAGLFGALSGAVGTATSTVAERMPTGPLIVLAATSLFVFSLVFAPRRGILAKVLHRLALRSRVARENALRAFYELAEAAGSWDLKVTLEQLASLRGSRPATFAAAVARLQREGLVAASGGSLALTEAGLAAAHQVVRNHRLWEMFLMHEGLLNADHVDRDADMIEHHLPADTVAELERLLRLHGREMELSPSVHPVRS